MLRLTQQLCVVLLPLCLPVSDITCRLAMEKMLSASSGTGPGPLQGLSECLFLIIC